MFGFGGKKSTSQEQNALIDATAGDEVSIVFNFFNLLMKGLVLTVKNNNR